MAVSRFETGRRPNYMISCPQPSKWHTRIDVISNAVNSSRVLSIYQRKSTSQFLSPTWLPLKLERPRQCGEATRKTGATNERGEPEVTPIGPERTAMRMLSCRGVLLHDKTKKVRKILGMSLKSFDPLNVIDFPSLLGSL